MRQLVHLPSISISTLGEVLDGLSHEDRWAALSTMSRSDQRALYNKAADAAPLTVEDFAPKALGARIAVEHKGRNTLPTPSGLRFFSKVACRPEGDDSRVFGFNEGWSRKFIGPGYYVGYSTSEKPEWHDRGSFVIDYYQVPDGPVADGWPKVVENSVGLQMLVYKGTRDYMRRVSAHVTIGAAYKGETKLDHYFLLVRQPV